MKTTKILAIILFFFALSSCNHEDSEIIKNDNQEETKLTVQNPDWYHFKYIDFYDKWGLKITALIKNNNVIGVYSRALNRTDFKQVGYYWSKSYSSRDREYKYRISLQYKLETQKLNFAWGVNLPYWWDAWGENAQEEVDYFNGQTTTGITAGTSELTYYIKRSDTNSMEAPAACINGNCPE